MRRIGLVVVLALSVTLTLLAAEAQESGKIYRIGYLSSGTATANAGLRKAFTDGLRDHGWVEGKNIAIEYRWEGAGKTTLDALAAELKRLPLDAIFGFQKYVFRLMVKRSPPGVPRAHISQSSPLVHSVGQYTSWVERISYLVQFRASPSDRKSAMNERCGG